MEREYFIYWFTGLFEGEGTFCIVKEKAKAISITSTDIDVLKRIQHFLNGSICTTTKRKEHWKEAYIWTLYGIEAKKIIQEIFPYLLERRKIRASEWIKLYEDNILIQEEKKHKLSRKIKTVFDLYSQGLTHLEIAKQTGYERSSVSKLISNKNKI